MDLLLKSESKGIHYEGYETDFIQCIFEESDVGGRNERYEFRCRPDLECCGRLCCIPQEAVIPLWLLVLFIILALLLLCALLGSIAWLCGKRRAKPKHIQPRRAVNERGDGRSHANTGYRSYKQNESQEALSPKERLMMENAYSTPADNLAINSNRGVRVHGYKNPMYDMKGPAHTMHQSHGSYRHVDEGIFDKTGNEGRSRAAVNEHHEQLVPIEKTSELKEVDGDRKKFESSFNKPRTNGGTGDDYFHEKFEEKFEEKYEVSVEEPKEPKSEIINK